jgi:hypothetical protein
MAEDRPSMQQDWHPDHSMPAPEHDGVVINDHGRGASLSDAAQRGSKSSPVTEPMPVTPYGDLPRGAYD